MKYDRYFHRELSWLEFNYRVLEESLDHSNPLLERLKFSAIFSNNLDEFIMVRVAGLVAQAGSDTQLKDPSGYLPDEVLNKILERTKELVSIQYKDFKKKIYKSLVNEGFTFYTAKTIPEKYLAPLEEYFIKKLSLLLSPMAIDQGRPFPFLRGKSLNVLIKLRKKGKDEKLYSIIQVPSIDRFIPLPGSHHKNHYIYLEEVIKLFAFHFFKGFEILNSCVFRITRDSDYSIDEEDVRDLLSAIENELIKRKKGRPIRLEVEDTDDKDLINFLKEQNTYFGKFIFKINGPLDMTDFFKIAFMQGFDNLKEKELPPIMSKEFADHDKSIFDIISEKDRLLSLPFESFEPVTRLIKEASNDPKVLAIKQTLYRTSGDSPIIAALQKAAINGKQVTVLVELKARFDEQQNINWAKRLEKDGCHVIYGLVGLKTHCKIALVVRDEENGLKRYIHLSTGNYNDKTAKIYTDIGLFTCRKSIGRDVSAIFNLITGYSDPPRWRKLVCAPLDLRDFFLQKINTEIENAKNGGKAEIIAKMNSLIDIKIIDTLYKASNANVNITLIVRGMCRLKPGIKGLSENIKVISVVDRFLEHSRIYKFHNGGDELIFLASADWMERNFDRRVETLFPIDDDDLMEEIDKHIQIILKDNCKVRILNSDGSYWRPTLTEKDKIHRSQIELYEYISSKNDINKKDKAKDNIKFIPKMNPNEKM